MLHGIDILSLDSSCMEDFQPAPIVRNAKVSGYDAKSERGNIQFAEVSYICDQGYKLEDPQISSLFCQQRRWRGKLPKCVETNLKEKEMEECETLGSCEQLCYEKDGGPVCSCYEGFILADNKETCEDINECNDNNGGCSQICENRPGTFICSCAPGYSAYGGSVKGDCLDINECLLNNGHGPYQDTSKCAWIKRV